MRPHRLDALKIDQAEQQRHGSTALGRRYDTQALDLARQVRALDRIEEGERKSLEMALNKERRIMPRARAGVGHMPALE